MRMGSDTVDVLLRRRAEEMPERTFAVCGERRLTFRKLDQRADAVAAGFQDIGVAPGDRVALLSTNRIELIEMYFALARIGAIQVPLNAYLKGEFLAHQLSDSGATFLVTDAAGLDAVAPLVNSLPALRTAVTLAGHGDQPEPANTISYDTLAELGTAPTEVDVTSTQLMSIMYTSGTTGFPKGCMLSHAYYVRAGTIMADAMSMRDDDTLYTALPLFHAAARNMVVAPALIRGIPVVVEPEFRAEAFFPRAGAVGAMLGFSVGAMAAALLALPPSDADRRHRLRTLHVVPFPADKQIEFAERFGVDPWAEVYGQTECVPALLNRTAGERRRSSCGKAAADLDVAILDNEDNDVAAGHVGEICVRPRRPRAMFDGYWQNPEATLKAFSSLWYHTGDYGRRDPDGYISFVDRKRDAIRRRGENISSVELEAAIAKHPKIAAVAVHAVPAKAVEDDIKAFWYCAQTKNSKPTSSSSSSRHPYRISPFPVTSSSLTSCPVTRSAVS